MTKEQISLNLDKMLSDSKSRNFINHLVRAYFPITKVNKVWDKPTGPCKCVLTKYDLISVQEILEGMQTEEFKQDLMKSMKESLDENSIKSNPIKNLTGDRLLGFTGTDTTTYMCQEALNAFYDWVVSKSLMNDKHINWLLGSIRRSSLIPLAENIQNPEVQKKVQKIKKQETRVTTYSLGDVDAFKKLRENFKD
jgi:23S rRNA A1618 N6-methylase RlmF